MKSSHINHIIRKEMSTSLMHQTKRISTLEISEGSDPPTHDTKAQHASKTNVHQSSSRRTRVPTDWLSTEIGGYALAVGSTSPVVMGVNMKNGALVWILEFVRVDAYHLV